MLEFRDNSLGDSGSSGPFYWVSSYLLECKSHSLTLHKLYLRYPIFHYIQRDPPVKIGSLNLGGANDSGQVAELDEVRSLIDPDTPLEARTKIGLDGKPMRLVFSDEFNVEEGPSTRVTTHFGKQPTFTTG